MYGGKGEVDFWKGGFNYCSQKLSILLNGGQWPVNHPEKKKNAFKLLLNR